MNELDPSTSTTEILAGLDGHYVAFPTFSEWVKATSIDLNEWFKFKTLLEQRRLASTDDQFDRACERVIRATAFDTGAIEGLYTTDRGFTFTVVADKASGWERSIEKRSEIALPIFNAQFDTYKVLFGNDDRTEITEVWIRWIHEHLCQAYPYYEARLPDNSIIWKELPLGDYKSMPNHVRLPTGGAHSYAPVDETPAEMHRLVNELTSSQFQDAHPVIQASYAHYALVVIHPFQDGNGRVARALASTFLFRAISIPLVVLAGDKEGYLDALEKADAGSFKAFCDFVYQRALDSIQLVLDYLPSVSVTTPTSAEDLASSLRSLMMVEDDLSLDQLQDKAYELLQSLVKVGTEFLSTLNLPPGITSNVQAQTLLQAPTEVPEFRPLEKWGNFGVICNIYSPAPAKAVVERQIRAFIAREPQIMPNVIRLTVDDFTDTLDLRVSEFHPIITPTAQLRIEEFVKRVITELMKEVLNKVTSSLQADKELPSN